MGDPSFLCFVPDESAACPIDWSKMPEASKKFFLSYWCYSWKTRKTTRDLPATIGDLVHRINETKFFRYLETLKSTLLLDLNKYGLKKQRTTGPHTMSVGPRFYMQSGDTVWFVLFEPGESDGVIGYSDHVVIDAEDEDENSKNKGKEVIKTEKKDVKGEESHDEGEEESNDEDEEESNDEDEEGYADVEATRMAREYDTKLVDEVGRLSTLGVFTCGKIAGWEAFTLKSGLEQAQLCDAMMSLPQGHPALRDYTQIVFQELRRQRN